MARIEERERKELRWRDSEEKMKEKWRIREGLETN
jgi:hypothetical protein